MNIFNNANPDINTLKPSILRTTHTSRPLHAFHRIINTGKPIPRYLGCCTGQSQNQQGVNSGLVAFCFLLLSPLDTSDHVGVQGNGRNALIFLLLVISCPDRVKILSLCLPLGIHARDSCNGKYLSYADMNSSNVTPHAQKYCPRVFKIVPKQRFSKCSRIYYTQVWLCTEAILKLMIVF